MKKFILASGSPRRRELLENVNLTFEVVVSDVKEVIDPNSEPYEIVQALAKQKASDVAQRVGGDVVVLGADTIVTIDNRILGKPMDDEDAKRMLRSLSGRQHIVYTGVALVSGLKTTTFYEKTMVQFWDLTDEEIEDYVKSGEPLDKAGAYGIQKLGSSLVKQITGDYFNVVGLPISRTIRELKKNF